VTRTWPPGANSVFFHAEPFTTNMWQPFSTHACQHARCRGVNQSPTSHHLHSFFGAALNSNFWWSATTSRTNPATNIVHLGFESMVITCTSSDSQRHAGL
jgi:hypothetical protein